MDDINQSTNNKFCKNLRVKNPYGMLEGGENDILFLDDINSICWCIKAVGGSGPDNGMVDPAQCVKGRACFEND